MMAAAKHTAAICLGDLLGAEAGGQAATTITDLVLDSRQVVPGAAFVAVQGGQEHGIRYAADALDRGAAVVLYEPGEKIGVAPRFIEVPRLKERLGELAEKFYGRAQPLPALCGITGTNGKTTVAYLAAQAMTRRGTACGYVGTLGYGVPPRLTTHALTTPDCFTLHRELAAMAARHAALEVSSHALAQDRIAGLRFGTAAFTNLTRDHLDAHGDLDHYGRAKARLFALPEVGCAVLNMNDAFAQTLARGLPRRVEAICAGMQGRVGGAELDLVAAFRLRGLDGIALHIRGRFGEATLESPLIGDFNAENLLVALGVLIAWGLPLQEACAALATCDAPPGRLEVLGPPADRPCVVVDYAHTPDALERVLAVLDGLTGGELWCVFGCGGDRDRGKRPLMGAAAAARADHIVLTDDNPRSEDPARIVADIREGLAVHPSVAVEHDRAAAIARAVRGARAGDVVLIAGKGHETSQLIGATTKAFSDRDVAAAVWAQRP